MSKSERKLFKMVEKEVIEVLKVCLNHGYTSIISNGTVEWIDSSMKTSMPSLYKFLVENQAIRVISARDDYEDKYPGESTKWKMKAFKAEIRDRFPRIPAVPVALMIIGDGRPEKESAKIFMGKEVNKFQVTMIRITEEPSCVTLVKELRFIRKAFASLLYKYGEMNLAFLHG